MFEESSGPLDALALAKEKTKKLKKKRRAETLYPSKVLGKMFLYGEP